MDSSVSVSVPDAPTEYTGSGEIFGRSFKQSVYGESDSASSVIRTVSDTLYSFSSRWDSEGVGSVPAQIASSAGLSPAVLEESDYAAVRRAFALAEETDGLFDPTIGALSFIWADGTPSADRISWALTYTGYEQVTLSDEEHFASIVHPGITIDLNAAVPGMAVEEALALYQKADIDGALLTMDGAAAMTGTKGENGEGFTLGLRDPGRSDGSHYAVLTAEDTVICTSDVQSGLLDPKTGYPAETDLASVTVLSKDGFTADAMSSVLYMQGLEGVKAHLKEADYQVIALTKSGEIYLSEGVREYFALKETKYHIIGENEE